MKCAEARDLILGADHHALRDRTDPVLAEHLSECAGCAIAASQVVADVGRLRAGLIARGARAAARPRRSTAKRVAMTLVPVALAAELAAFAFLGNRDGYNPMTDRRIIDDSVVSTLPVMHGAIDTGEVMIAFKNRRLNHAATAKDSAHDKTDSTKRRSGPLEYTSAQEMAQLQVRPASRHQRVVVLGTSDPKIHVVWLTKVDSL